MRLKPILVLLILVAALGLLMFQAVQRWKSIGPDNSPVRPPPEGSLRSSETPPAPSGQGIVTPQAMKEFLQLEQEKKHEDKTIWAPELLSWKYEQPFVDLWDNLRRTREKFSVLGNFPFERLRIPTAANTNHWELEIQQLEPAGSLVELTLDDWRDRLTAWYQAGFRLVQSEWRHPRFRPPQSPDGPAHSTIRLELHLEHAETGDRYIIKGPLQVTWKKMENEESNDPPQADVIDATGLEILIRRAAAPFSEVLNEPIRPIADHSLIDPLICRDLDRDGRVEIILVSRNLVYRNRGDFRFEAEPLIRGEFPEITAGVIGDFDNDGRDDLLGATHQGLLLIETIGGERPSPPGSYAWQPENPMHNPFVLTSGDIDHDGDLDVWLAQYKTPYLMGQMPTPYYDANDGFPSFLLINQGDGTFTDETESRGLAEKRFRRTYSTSFIDLNEDDFLDLVVVSDFAGTDVYFNDGKGSFVDRTETALDNPHAFGMAHTFGDMNGDGHLDLFVIGMNSPVAERLENLGLGPAGRPEMQEMRPVMNYGNRLYLGRGKGQFRQIPLSRQVARSGWSWGVAAADFDNDGDLDLYIGNGHKSRATARDYDMQFWRHDIYTADSRHDPAREVYFNATARSLYGRGYSYGGHFRNHYFLNRNGEGFEDIGWLLGLGLAEDTRCVLSEDFDGDGRLDVVLTTYQVWPRTEQGLHVLRNQLPNSSSWIGFQMIPGRNGKQTEGARLVLETDKNLRQRWMVNGASYRSQGSLQVHFGMEPDEQPRTLRIHWPDGRTDELDQREKGIYHRIY